MLVKKPNFDRAVGWGLGIGAILIVSAILWMKFIETHAPPSRFPGIPQQWSFTADGSVIGSLALAGDGTIYVVSNAGMLYALDPSGSLKWKLNLGPIEASPSIGSDGTVYVTDDAQQIYAINSTGTQRWTFGGGPYADKRLGSIAGALDQNFLYTPWRGEVRAIRLSTGNPDHPSGIDFEVSGSVAVLSNGLILHPGNGRLEAADSEGRTVWEYPVRNPPLTADLISKYNGRPPAGNFWLDSAVAVGFDGTLYACASDSRFVAITPDGTLKWEFKTQTRTLNRASPVIAADGTIYFGSGEGILYALNSDGSQKWTKAISGAIGAAPLLAADGTIFVASGTLLNAVSPDGNIIAQSQITETVQSSPTLAPDGTLYLATTGGKVLAFAGGHGALMESSWPKFQHDAANTGHASTF